MSQQLETTALAKEANQADRTGAAPQIASRVEKNRNAKEFTSKLTNKKLGNTVCSMSPEILPKLQKMSETEKTKEISKDTKEPKKSKVVEERKEIKETKETNVAEDTEETTKVRETDKIKQPEETRKTNNSKTPDQRMKIKESEETIGLTEDTSSNLTEKNAEEDLATTTETIEPEASEDQSQPKVTMVPVLEKSNVQKPSNAAVPRKRPPMWTPVLNERPLVLATHLVPSLPVTLFEVLAEMIEVALQKPVVLLYEPRKGRKVAKDVVDIAILPAAEEWEEGNLLGASFVFKHRLNKENTPCIYADILVASDRAPHVEDVNDLRGHRCALPDRTAKMGAAALLFGHLQSKGESPAFFGNILDANSQVNALQMIAGKQAEIGILESPVINCHKNSLPGVESLNILTSLGPLPPYRIMFNKKLSDTVTEKVTSYLLDSNEAEEWIEKLEPFGIVGFAENSPHLYNTGDMKPVITRVPYY